MYWLYIWITTQIVTESFPVSSSSHVRMLELLASKCDGFLFLQSLPKHFDEFFHFPTLIVLAYFFRHRWIGAITHLRRTWPIVLPLVARTALSCAVTVFFYLVFAVTHWNTFLPMSCGLVITALLLFSVRFAPRNFISPTFRTAFIVGLAQSCALFPGISRLGVTFVVGRWLGLSPRHALESSFAIHVPLIIVSVVRGAYELSISGLWPQLLNLPTGLVILVASVGAYWGLHLVWRMAIANTINQFAWYVGGLALIAFIIGG
jgi:undecaprenyl-diphosphatase